MKNDMSSSTSLAFVRHSPCTCLPEKDVEWTSFQFCDERLYLLTLCHDNGDNDHIHHVGVDFSLPSIPDHVDMNGIKAYHCNGVICLASVEYQNHIILCNPATKEFRLLPEPMLLDSFLIAGGGLGCDSRDKSYKFVIFGDDEDAEVQNTRAKIYSLDTNAWREIAVPIEIDDYWFVGINVYCRGVLYWVVHPSRDKILAFDVSDEVFHFLPMPNNPQPIEEPQSQRFIIRPMWNESVALLSYVVGGTVQVWVMDDYMGIIKDCCSWIKKLTIGPLVGVLYPLAFCQDELLMKTRDGRLISYNLCTQKLGNLAIDGAAGISEIGMQGSYSSFDFRTGKFLFKMEKFADAKDLISLHNVSNLLYSKREVNKQRRVL